MTNTKKAKKNMPARQTTPTLIALAARVAVIALLFDLILVGGASAQSARLSAVRAPFAGQLVVPLNKSQVLKLDVPYKEVSVGTPEIAEVVPVSQNTIYVLGRKLGSTSLIFGGDGGRVLAIADLVVGYDTDSLKQKLYEVAPNEPIEVRTANDALVLSGRVSSSDKLQRITALAEQYAPKKVTNLLNVGGSQQVLLQVRFAEVDREFLKSLGISEAFINGGTTAFRLLSGVGLSNAFAGLGSANGLLGGATTPFANLTFHEGDFDANIQILERKGVITLLAEPNLTALSGDTASFLAGGEFPIPVAQNGNGFLGTTITVEFKPFGVSLNFTPTVVAKDIINLVLKSEVSDIDRNLSVFSALPGQVAIPGLRVRRTETTVEVRDGQAFMISGLLQHNFQDAVQQFPWLGDVPVLGALFRSPEYRQRRTELVVFITPRLVQPVVAGGLKSPTDGFLVPSEAALFLNGQVEARPGQGEPLALPPVPLPESGLTDAGGLDGPHGYILK
jgi:pilus assembly protein CpaC